MHVFKVKVSEPTGMTKEMKIVLDPVSYCILQHLFL